MYSKGELLSHIHYYSKKKMTKANIWMTHPMCLYILKNDAPCFGLNPPSSARKHHSKRHSSQRGLAYEYSPITICHEFINICKVLKARRKQELAPPAPHHRWPGRTDSSEEAALNKHTRFLEGWELRGRLEADCGAILRQTGKPHISHREVRQQVQPNTSKHIQTRAAAASSRPIRFDPRAIQGTTNPAVK